MPGIFWGVVVSFYFMVVVGKLVLFFKILFGFALVHFPIT
jgi:hypothetical protein